MPHSGPFYDRCHVLFADALGHGSRWKSACAIALEIGRATLYRYFEPGAAVPTEVLERLDRLERASRPLPAAGEMVARYARALADVQERVDADGSLRKGLPPNARRAFDIAAALNFQAAREVWPTDLAVLVTYAQRPIYEWLTDLSWDPEGEFTAARLIDSGAITAECARLAAPGRDVETELTENAGYLHLRRICEALPSQERDRVYAAWRRFVITNPVLPSWTTVIYRDPVLSILDGIDALVERFYQPVPESMALGGRIPICTVSGTILRRHGRAFESDCREPEATRAARDGEHREIPHRLGMVHLRRAFRMFWCLPGRAELDLERRLQSAGWACTMWPRLDRVDIVAVSRDGSRRLAIDVKDHISPVSLAAGFPGFKDYTVDHECFVVVPDYILTIAPHFISRFAALRTSFARTSVTLRSISGFLDHMGVA